MQQPVESHNLTGYEPNNLVGKGPGPGNGPMALGPTQTTGSASSSSAARQIVPADTLATDLGNILNDSMISLEDVLEDPLVPFADNFIVESGPKGIAIPSGTAVNAPKDVGHHGASLKKQARISDDGKPKDDGHHGKPAKQARFSRATSFI